MHTGTDSLEFGAWQLLALRAVKRNMRRLLIIPAAVLAAAPVAFASAPASAPASSSKAQGHGSSALGKTHLRGFVCQRALDPPARAVSVVAVMRPVTATKSMSMRFQLLTKTTGARWTQVHGGDLGTWVSPKPATLGERPGDVWVLNHPVADLPAPASYKFKVSFRWTGAGGAVLATADRVSAVCVQPELRPDLRVVSVTIGSVAAHPNLAQYTVKLANLGTSAAGPFDVRFAAGSVVKTHTVNRLGPHQKRTDTFLGPLCSSVDAPTVVVDPTQTVDDLNRADNSLTVPAGCPTVTRQ